MSSRALGAMLSGAALAGWLAGSTLNPPVAVSQVAPRRPVAAAIARAELPRLTWPVAAARVAPPAPTRNPFLFSATDRGTPPPAGAPAVASLTATPVPAAEVALAAAPASAWRLSGIATSEDGDVVAVLSGGGDVFLLRAGDALPGGDVVEDVGPAHVVVRTAAGAVTLRLP